LAAAAALAQFVVFGRGVPVVEYIQQGCKRELKTEVEEILELLVREAIAP
jgi:hypothetical protein